MMPLTKCNTISPSFNEKKKHCTCTSQFSSHNKETCLVRHHLSRRLRLRHEVLDESCGEHDSVAIDEQLRLSGEFVDLRLVCECEKLL